MNMWQTGSYLIAPTCLGSGHFEIISEGLLSDDAPDG
jgi:hypothetical protein